MGTSVHFSGIRFGSLITFLLCLVTACGPVIGQQVGSRKQSAQQHQIQPSFPKVEELILEGRLDEAKTSIQGVLTSNPSSVDAYNLLGIICNGQKDFFCAEEAFQQALKLNPISSRTHNNLGDLYVTEGKPDLAEREFGAVLRLDPANRDANYNLGVLLLAKHQPTTAVAHLQRVRPATLETELNLVRAYLAANQNASALELASKLSTQYATEVQVHFTLGVLLASAKQYKTAQLELEKANALQPGTLEILYNLGQVYLQAGEVSKAEVAFDRAIKLKPDSADALLLQSQVYQKENRAIDALEVLLHAHTLAPENVDIIAALARASIAQSNFEDAIPLLQSGVQIAPQRADLHAALGESYFQSGKVEKAIGEFKLLVGMDPSPRSYGLLALTYRHLGRFDEARKYSQEGLKREPKNALCLFNLGYIEERQGNTAQAEEMFRAALGSDPTFSDALLELANLRIASKNFREAAELLRKYVKVSSDPASGYYKLALVERSLHQDESATKDLATFQALSRDKTTDPYHQHLFDYLNRRSNLSPQARTQQELSELAKQVQQHGDRAQDFYFLASTQLKLGRVDEAKQSIARLDQLGANDYRAQLAAGVLLARYRLYDDAIERFRTALRISPDSDDAKFDLADAYFRKAQYKEALAIAQSISAAGQKDDAFLALMGDLNAHSGNTAQAVEIFGGAIKRNPDNDQNYLSLALIQLRSGGISEAQKTLTAGLSRIPASGKILWGLGLVSALQGNTVEAEQRLARSVDLLPEWSGTYATLGVLYYQTGQIAKAREVLARFKGNNTGGGLDIGKIEEALERAPAATASSKDPMPLEARQQLLQLALTLADRTL